MKALDRRTLLAGLGGAVGLPLLDAMTPALARPRTSLALRPNRMAFLFVPNGAHMAAWTPTAEGVAFDLPATLAPLAGVRDRVTVMTGLAQMNASALGDGGGDHARSTAAWLTGCHPRKTDGADIRNGVSIDQVAAQRIGARTRFASLEIGCERGAQAGNCDSGYSCAYSSNIAWRSETTPVAKEVNPRAVFDRLFAGTESSETAEARGARERDRRSVLDFVLDDASRLRRTLGPSDRRKLDEYLSSVRDVEQRITRAGVNEQVLAAARGRAPEGIPADYGEHIRLMCDVLVLAFQTDQTRICTFMFANDGSNRSYRSIGAPEGHHDLSHHAGDTGKQAKIALINRFHVEQLAYLLGKLKSIPEGDHTLLDHSMIVYGAGISDGNQHNHDDLPILLCGGGAGTVRPGRHVRYRNPTPMTNLFLSMLDRMDVPTEKLGDSTGKLQGLT